MNDNKNISYLKLWNVGKMVFSEEFVTLGVSIRKEESLKGATYAIEYVLKKEHKKPKERSRKAVDKGQK